MISKYTTHKNPANKQRLMFHINPENSSTCVVVEDIVSAIVVNKATGFAAIAVLTNSIGDDIIVTLRQYSSVIVWLDYDIRVSAIKQTKRLKALGLNVTCKTTLLDPKNHTQQEIKEILL